MGLKTISGKARWMSNRKNAKTIKNFFKIAGLKVITYYFISINKSNLNV